MSITIGVLAALLIAELSYRFFLFGFKLHYQDDRIIDKTFFSKDKKHIFFVGDSFTAGYPFPIDQSYPAILDKRLKNNKIKITNFAMKGTDLIKQLCIIKQISELYPVLIVWGISSNDLCALENNKIDLKRLDNYQSIIFKTRPITTIDYLKTIFYGLPRDCIFRRHMSIFSTIKEILTNYSYIYISAKNHLGEKAILRFLKAKHNDRTELQEVAMGSLEYYKNGIDPNRVFESTFATISYVKNLLQKKGIDLVVLLVPQETDLNEKLFQENIRQFNIKISDYNQKNPRKFLNDFCLNNNICFIDSSDYMQNELEHGNYLFMKYDRHYNHLGNTALAQFLSKNKIFLSRINNDNL